jgi:hypothetical protein
LIELPRPYSMAAAAAQNAALARAGRATATD